MPIDKNPNGKTPKLNLPEELHFQRTQVVCRRCGKAFQHLTIEEIDNLQQLRCGDALITDIEATCPHCGWVFSWYVRTRDLPKIAADQAKIMKKIGMYKAE